MADFTAGPWRPGHMTDHTSTCQCRSIICEWYMGSIADIPKCINKPISEGGNDCPPEHEARANAWLISAAPDLYHALDDLVAVTEGDSAFKSVVDKAKKALAQARGEEVP
jgi:hypothetical protein